MQARGKHANMQIPSNQEPSCCEAIVLTTASPCHPMIQGQNDWRVTYASTEICASKGSTVEMSCTYTYPPRENNHDVTVQETFWFTTKRTNVDLTTDSQYSGRVQNICDNNKCTLRITDLRESDSAEYKFRFTTNLSSGTHTGSPGVTLSVTALQVQVNTISVRQEYTNAELKCHSSCSPAGHLSYVWFDNGQKVKEETSSYKGWFHPKDFISCALKGHENYSSPPVCVHGQNCNRVTYTDRNICASKGSSVDISCTYNSYDGSITSKFWFSPERSDQWQSRSQTEDLSEDSLYAGRVQVLETETGRSTLRIRDLRESDSAQYHFKFKTPWFEWKNISPGTTLTVTALQVQVNTISVTQNNTEAELKCHSSCSPAGRFSYVWFKNGQKVREETSSYKGWFHPEDLISCALKGHENYSSPSVYAPKLPSVSVSPSGEIVENSSVTLTCSSDANPAANYTWYKENEDSPRASGQIFTITDFRPEHSGNYYCEAQNRRGRHNSTLHLIVVAGSMKSVAVGSITAIVLAIIFLCAFLLIRRKKCLKQTTERPDNNAQLNMGTVSDNHSAAVQRTPAEEQDDLCYASVSYSKQQEDPLYSNIRPIQPNRHKNEEQEEEDEGSVEYSVVKLKSGSASSESRRQVVVQDPSALYSTVTKNPRV